MKKLASFLDFLSQNSIEFSLRYVKKGEFKLRYLEVFNQKFSIFFSFYHENWYYFSEGKPKELKTIEDLVLFLN